MIKIDELANEINKNMRQYSNFVEEELEVATEEVTKNAVKELKQKSPKQTGAYAKGWTRKKFRDGIVIHNRRYQLTHLLEYGHAKVNGGRVAPKVHIRPVEEKAVKEFEERVERAIRQ
jgi:hypothetical protein